MSIDEFINWVKLQNPAAVLEITKYVRRNMGTGGLKKTHAAFSVLEEHIQNTSSGAEKQKLYEAFRRVKAVYDDFYAMYEDALAQEIAPRVPELEALITAMSAEELRAFIAAYRERLPKMHEHTLTRVLSKNPAIQAKAQELFTKKDIVQ